MQHCTKVGELEDGANSQPFQFTEFLDNSVRNPLVLLQGLAIRLHNLITTSLILRLLKIQITFVQTLPKYAIN